MARIKLTLEYDGTAYVGWQVQPNGVAIQEKVEAALAALLKEPVRVVAAGRTDAGVHAEGQVVCFSTARDLPLKAYAKGLSAFLPEDIAVVSAEDVLEAFDPRRDAKGKRYVYRISNRRRPSPLRRRSHWQVFLPLDVKAMQDGAKALIGKHDFGAFQAANCEAQTTVRKLWRVDVQGAAGEDVTITVEGTAFLKHMVRNMVGTLVDVGRGKHPASWVAEVLAGRDRMASGPTAPAHGLTLERVFYE